MMMTTEVCSVCGWARAEHYDLVHAFSEGGRLAKSGQEGRQQPRDRTIMPDMPVDGSNSSPKSIPTALPSDESTSMGSHEMPLGDPILRMALIRAGVISVDQLEEIESELRATGISFAEPG